MQSVAFVAVVFGNKATTYTNRERQRMRACLPSRWLAGSSVMDLTIASTLAIFGVAMAPAPAVVVGAALLAAAAFAFLLDFAKVPAFKRLEIV